MLPHRYDETLHPLLILSSSISMTCVALDAIFARVSTKSLDTRTFGVLKNCCVVQNTLFTMGFHICYTSLFAALCCCVHAIVQVFKFMFISLSIFCRSFSIGPITRIPVNCQVV